MSTQFPYTPTLPNRLCQLFKRGKRISRGSCLPANLAASIQDILSTHACSTDYRNGNISRFCSALSSSRMDVVLSVVSKKIPQLWGIQAVYLSISLSNMQTTVLVGLVYAPINLNLFLPPSKSSLTISNMGFSVLSMRRLPFVQRTLLIDEFSYDPCNTYWVSLVAACRNLAFRFIGANDLCAVAFPKRHLIPFLKCRQPHPRLRS